jgi:hypothetical protein
LRFQQEQRGVVQMPLRCSAAASEQERCELIPMHANMQDEVDDAYVGQGVTTCASVELLLEHLEHPSCRHRWA